MKDNQIPTTVRSQMRDIALIVSYLSDEAKAEDIAKLQEHCTDTLNKFDHDLETSGAADQDRQMAGYAASALLDEAALRKLPETDRQLWGAHPLQVTRYGDYQGGERVFEHIRQELAKPAPSLWLLSAWQVTLSLGFKGKYIHEGEVARQQVLAVLDERLAMFNDLTPISEGSKTIIHWRSFSPLIWAVLCWCLVGILYMTLQAILKTAIATLIPG